MPASGSVTATSELLLQTFLFISRQNTIISLSSNSSGQSKLPDLLQKNHQHVQHLLQSGHHRNYCCSSGNNPKWSLQLTAPIFNVKAHPIDLIKLVTFLLLSEFIRTQVTYIYIFIILNAWRCQSIHMLYENLVSRDLAILSTNISSIKNVPIALSFSANPSGTIAIAQAQANSNCATDYIEVTY